MSQQHGERLRAFTWQSSNSSCGSRYPDHPDRDTGNHTYVWQAGLTLGPALKEPAQPSDSWHVFEESHRHRNDCLWVGASDGEGCLSWATGDAGVRLFCVLCCCFFSVFSVHAVALVWLITKYISDTAKTFLFHPPLPPVLLQWNLPGPSHSAERGGYVTPSIPILLIFQPLLSHWNTGMFVPLCSTMLSLTLSENTHCQLQRHSLTHMYTSCFASFESFFFLSHSSSFVSIKNIKRNNHSNTMPVALTAQLIVMHSRTALLAQAFWHTIAPGTVKVTVTNLPPFAVQAVDLLTLHYKKTGIASQAAIPVSTLLSSHALIQT